MLEQIGEWLVTPEGLEGGALRVPNVSPEHAGSEAGALPGLFAAMFTCHIAMHGD